ncbi:MAG TPA: hydantoinase/oxoprolinase family protein, partial [Baekduia sp.]|nr:hydantoinase/oxoprolinase family protein [Baekduia sp.]
MPTDTLRRVSVDIGGTFTDCFLVWDGEQVQAKALTTHHNLALGFDEALGRGCEQLGVDRETVLSEIDSVRYATTLGTNALIERDGPRVGLLITEGFESTVPLSRGRGYAEGIAPELAMDLTRARRPEPLVPPTLIRGVKQRLDHRGRVLRPLDEDDVRRKLRELMDEGAQVLVVTTANGIANPEHERRIRELFLEEYPTGVLGSIPIILSSEVTARRGEYVRTMSAVIDAYLHPTMYHGMAVLEESLRKAGYRKPVLLVHNTAGMAQLNSTDALRTVHSGPVAGIHAAGLLAADTSISSIVTADMGGTSFDIGIVVDGGVKHYDFMPVVDRWLITLPMVHLSTLGSGGGSIARYDGIYGTLRVGPESAGSDPGPACYDAGGLAPTVTDADLLLGYLNPDGYARGAIPLSRDAALLAMEDLCAELGLEPLEVARLIRARADLDMATGIGQELRVRGYRPEEFTMLAFGGNGPLHCCSIARAAGIRRVLVPPFASVFSASGASSLDQVHFHEHAEVLDLLNPTTGTLYDRFDDFNAIVERLEDRGRGDLVRQGVDPAAIVHRLELDLRYGAQRVETTVTTDRRRLRTAADVLELIDRFGEQYAKRFGEQARSPESGVRIETVRVASSVENAALSFDELALERLEPRTIDPVGHRMCSFPGVAGELQTAVFDRGALEAGVTVDGPAVVEAGITTYLVEPGWRFVAAGKGAAWLVPADLPESTTTTQTASIEG